MIDPETRTREIEQQTGHRPWPMPGGPWVMFQSWQSLLFAHWPVPARMLRPHIPDELEIDEHDGTAWLGQTPFRISGLRARFLPPIPGTSDFPEMNLRTYVRVHDRPGVFFFSLDAGNRAAVVGARLGYRLPYFPAEMELREDAEWYHFRSRRTTGGAAEFRGRYRPIGPARHPERGSLEYFLTERYALYARAAEGLLLRGDIHHGPWPLQAAEAVIETNTVPAAHDLTVPGDPPLLHFSRQQDTLIWLPKPVHAASR